MEIETIKPDEFPSKPPDEFAVIDLQGQIKTSEEQRRFCNLSSLPEIDSKFFEKNQPLHQDFIQNQREKMIFKIFAGIVVIVGLLVALIPIYIGMKLGSYFNWSSVALPLGIVFLLFLFLPFNLWVRSIAENAWRRYATWVYSNAEPKPIRAYHAKNSYIILTYPNNFAETVEARFYNSNYSLLTNLRPAKTVMMRRDRNSNPSVVILEIDGERIWCTAEIVAPMVVTVKES